MKHAGIEIEIGTKLTIQRERGKKFQTRLAEVVKISGEKFTAKFIYNDTKNPIWATFPHRNWKVVREPEQRRVNVPIKSRKPLAKPGDSLTVQCMVDGVFKTRGATVTKVSEIGLVTAKIETENAEVTFPHHRWRIHAWEGLSVGFQSNQSKTTETKDQVRRER